MPRSIDVVLRNDNTEKGQPGDILKVVGYLCVSPDISSMLKPGERTQLSTKNQNTRGNMGEMEGLTGVKGIRELNYKLIFIATSIKVENNQFA
jgi:DNA replication licensing factor MCM6